MIWSSVELGTIAEIQSGGTPRRSQVDYYGGGVPWAKIGDLDSIDGVVRKTEETLSEKGVCAIRGRVFPRGTVLLAMYGSVGKLAVAGVDLTTNQAILGISARDVGMLDHSFLKYWLAHIHEDLTRRAHGVTQRNLSATMVRKLKIPLPPLSEQRRIVEILDQADHLRRLRADANAKAGRILPALFLKMFGDPATNPMRWPVEPVNAAVKSVEAGWSAKGEARHRKENEFGVLKVSAVTSGTFRPAEHKAVPFADIDRALVIPRRGDLLFSRANTRELVAAACVVESDASSLFLPDKLWRITVRPERATALFLNELLRVPSFRDTLRARATGTSGSMLNVSQAAFLATRAPLPPLKLQQTFSDLGWKMMEARRANRASCGHLGRMWALLLGRAFSGRLTSSWRRENAELLMAESTQQIASLSGVPDGN